jgi:hypothetical protein
MGPEKSCWSPLIAQPGTSRPRSDAPASANARTAGVHWRVDPEDMVILDGNDDRGRAELIAERLRRWKSIANA